MTESREFQVTSQGVEIWRGNRQVASYDFDAPEFEGMSKRAIEDVVRRVPDPHA